VDATLTFHEAPALQGHPARYAVELDSLPNWTAGYVVYDCVSPAGESRTVYLLPGQDAAEVPPAARPGGTFFPGFTELRVTDARRCR
jgi:hypothetical protein